MGRIKFKVAFGCPWVHSLKATRIDKHPCTSSIRESLALGLDGVMYRLLFVISYSGIWDVCVRDV
jgi:hypothetical protein